MLSRAFHGRKPYFKSTPKRAESSSTISTQQSEDEDCIVGLTGDLPLVVCDSTGSCKAKNPLTLREVMMGSVQMMGESGLGISEKVVLLDATVYAAKRLKRVCVGRKEFGRRVERVAHVSRGSEHVLQVRAYLYAKRIKLVLCDYYPMGSLADLLYGARELGHTPLDSNQRFTIIYQVAKAVSYIHGQAPSNDKHFQPNIHGNIKTSNVLIRTNFSACLSEYGFIQLTDHTEAVAVWQSKLPELINLREKMSQKSDVCSYGLMMLDVLGGPEVPTQVHCVMDKKVDIKAGVIEFFEFFLTRDERKQALQVLDIALACTNRSPEARPSMEQVLLNLQGILY